MSRDCASRHSSRIVGSPEAVLPHRRELVTARAASFAHAGSVRAVLPGDSDDKHPPASTCLSAVCVRAAPEEPRRSVCGRPFAGSAEAYHQRKERMAARILIGTSGWSYKHWKGVFYPDDLPARDWLRYYASRFETVELNTTFYRTPAGSTFSGWRGRCPRVSCSRSRRAQPSSRTYWIKSIDG